MKLKKPLLDDVRQCMDAHHGAWHLARVPRDWMMTVEDQLKWDKATEIIEQSHPNQPLIEVTKSGAGEQFLEMHRTMLGEFFAMAQARGFVLPKWGESLPADLMYSPKNPVGLTEEYVAKSTTRVEEIINDPDSTADDLGNFLESTQLDTSLGSDIHNQCHKVIAAVEYRDGKLEEYQDAEMDNFSTAHRNVQFWQLHEWLDRFYTRWQETHRDPDDFHAGHIH